MKKNITKHSKGYILIYNPEHPYKNKDGYVPEHRLVMEKKLGYYINPLINDVHHINKDLSNNRLNNLLFLTKSEHKRLHNGWKKIKNEWCKTCNGCGIFMKVNGNFYKRKSGSNEYMTKCKKCIIKQAKTNNKKKKKRWCNWCGKIEYTKTCQSKSLKKVCKSIIKELKRELKKKLK